MTRHHTQEAANGTSAGTHTSKTIQMLLITLGIKKLQKYSPHIDRSFKKINLTPSLPQALIPCISMYGEICELKQTWSPSFLSERESVVFT